MASKTTPRKTPRLLPALWLPLLTLCGCEFGNKSTVEQSGYDTLSGYYSALPQSIGFEATVASDTRTRAGTINEIPGFLKLVLNNPTIVNFVDPIQGIGAIQSRQNPNAYIYTRIDAKTGRYGASTTGQAVVGGCEFRQTIVHNGTISQTPTSEMGGVAVRGRIALDYELTYTTTGDETGCQALRDDQRDCYVSGTNCSEDPESIFNRDFLAEIFDPFVTSGQITAAEIADTRSLTYRARYE